ncbi:MAG: arylesterase [Gemmatimonadales bacterium]
MIVRYGWLLALVALAACGERPAGEAEPERAAENPAAGRPEPAAAGPPVILFVGTSLTAGYGLPSLDLAFPALIQKKLDSAGLDYRAVNAGVSGESSAGALARIDWLLGRHRVAVLVIETGANDGLRGQDPDSVRGRIQAIIDRARRESPPPRIVLTGMEALPNLGADYARRFRGIYPELARVNGIALVPFLLTGVAGVDSLNQGDGIHPTAEGQRIVAENVWRVLREVVDGRL